MDTQGRSTILKLLGLVAVLLASTACNLPDPCTEAGEACNEDPVYDENDECAGKALVYADCILDAFNNGAAQCTPELKLDCASLPYCGDGIVDPGEQCDDGNSVDGDGCENDCTFTPGGTFEITRVSIAPQLNLFTGIRPYYTGDMAVGVFVESTEGMSSLQAEVLNCNPAEVADCTPVSDSPPSATSWSLRLPGFTGSAGGTIFTVQVTAEGSGGQGDQQTVDFDVYPADPGLDVTCTKRYDSGSLYVAFTLVDNGNLPVDPSTGNPYTLADMFDARYLLYQEGQSTGFDLDETDSFRGTFFLEQPTELNPDDDGIYEMIFTGQLGFVEPIQTHLLFDTIGGDNDVCTLVP